MDNVEYDKTMTDENRAHPYEEPAYEVLEGVHKCICSPRLL
jgi:hypothetical protein